MLACEAQTKPSATLSDDQTRIRIAPMKIVPRDITIKQAFENFYEIPRFQRPYSWEAENVEALWRDIMSSRSAEYFLGSMIVYAEGGHTLRIIDGQQRLTTLSLLLAAIRDIAKQYDLEDLSLGTQRCLRRSDVYNKTRNVLAMTGDGRKPYLQETYLADTPERQVDEADKTDEMKAIDTAYETLIKKIQEEVPELNALNTSTETYESEVDDLFTIDENDEIGPPIDTDQTNLSNRIGQQLTDIRDLIFDVHILLIELDKEEDAYTIFETINTRGLELSITDLYKNLLLKHLCAESENDKFNTDWTNLVERIDKEGNTTVDTFLYHSWNSRHTFSTRPKLYTNARELVSDKGSAESLLKELEADWESYKLITNPDLVKGNSDVWNPIQRSLNALKDFKVQQNIPFVIALLQAYKRKIIRPAHVRNTLSTIEKFHFCFTAITNSRSSGGISSMYCKHARELTNATSADEAHQSIKELMNKLVERLPSKELFISKFTELEYSAHETKKKPLIQYILRNLALPADGLTFPLDSELTIEHLLPQVEAERGSVDVSIVGNIGNLFYLTGTDNNDLKTLSYTEKKQLLEEKGNLPRTLQDIHEWNEQQIMNRARILAMIAYDEVWRL